MATHTSQKSMITNTTKKLENSTKKRFKLLKKQKIETNRTYKKEATSKPKVCFSRRILPVRIKKS